MKENNEVKDHYNWSDEVNKDCDIIEKTLESYGIKARVAAVNYLPKDHFQYCLEITLGTKIEDIEKRKRELALALASASGKVTIQAPIPGKSLIGITIRKIRKPKKEEKTGRTSTLFDGDPPKTIVGIVLMKIAEVLLIVAVGINFFIEKTEKNKSLYRQVVASILVPTIYVIIFHGTFNFGIFLEYIFVTFITLVFLIGFQKEDKKKNDEIKIKENEDDLVKG